MWDQDVQDTKETIASHSAYLFWQAKGVDPIRRDAVFQIEHLPFRYSRLAANQILNSLNFSMLPLTKSSYISVAYSNHGTLS